MSEVTICYHTCHTLLCYALCHGLHPIILYSEKINLK